GAGPWRGQRPRRRRPRPPPPPPPPPPGPPPPPRFPAAAPGRAPPRRRTYNLARHLSRLGAVPVPRPHLRSRRRAREAGDGFDVWRGGGNGDGVGPIHAIPAAPRLAGGPGGGGGGGRDGHPGGGRGAG